MLSVNIEKKMADFLLKMSFTCDDSHLLALTGPSGAGKTTLIRILAGLEKADSGHISYNGTVWFDSEKDIFLSPQERAVGYVFQEHALFPHMTIAENVTFIAQDKGKALDLLNLFHISHIANRKPHQVSGGERQRAAFAQALAREPEVLLLDEPFSALDPDTRIKLQNELIKVKTSHAFPVIHVTHDLDEAELLADSSLHVERPFLPSPVCCSAKRINKTSLLPLLLLVEWSKWLKRIFYPALPSESEAGR